MRYGIIGEGVVEKAVVGSGLLPRPMLEGYAMVSTQALLVAVKIGIFESLADGPASADAIATRCGCDGSAVAKLCNLLVAMGYLRVDAAATYRLSRGARRWLTGDRREATASRPRIDTPELLEG